jgi:hypothetical protein
MEARRAPANKSMDLFKYEDADRDFEGFSRTISSEDPPNVLGSEVIALHALLLHLVEELSDSEKKIRIPIFPEGVKIAPRAIAIAQNKDLDMTELLRQYFLETLTKVGVAARENDKPLLAGEVSVGTVLDYNSPSNIEGWLGWVLISTRKHRFHTMPGTKHDDISMVSNPTRFQISYEREFSSKKKLWDLRRVKVQLVNLSVGMIYVITALYTWYYVKHRPWPWPIVGNADFSVLTKTVGKYVWPTYQMLLTIWHEIMEVKYRHAPMQFTCYRGLVVPKSSDTTRIMVGKNKLVVVEDRRLRVLVKDPKELGKRINHVGMGSNSTVFNVGMKGMVMKVSFFDDDARTELAMFKFIQEAGIGHVVPTVLPRYIVFSGRFGENHMLFIAKFIQRMDKTLMSELNVLDEARPIDETDFLRIYELLTTFENHGFIHHDLHPGNIISKYSAEEGRRQWLLIDFGGAYYTGPDPERPIYPYGFNYLTNTPSTPDEMYRITWTRVILPRPVPHWDIFGLASHLLSYFIPKMRIAYKHKYETMLVSFVRMVITMYPVIAVVTYPNGQERLQYRSESLGIPNIVIDPPRY